MDKGKNITQILEKIEAELKEEFGGGISYPNQHSSHTNPQKDLQNSSIYKKLNMFRNAKIGDKFSLRDLFR